jgi:DNA primase
LRPRVKGGFTKEDTVEDRHKPLREIPFEALAGLLDFNLSDFKQRKNGSEWVGPCPVNKGRSKTAFNYASDGKWHCFSCEAKGRGSIDLVMAVRKCSFRDAVALLEPLGASLPPPMTHEAVSDQAPQASDNKPFQGTYEKFQVASPWLTARGFTQETLDRFEVFQYDNPKRRSVYSGSVMLKIRRYSDGECVGYLSRNIGEITPQKPKYRFPKDFQKSLELFGAWQIKNAAASGASSVPRRVAYLVESPFCVMKFAQLGIAAVSPFGWSLSVQQVPALAALAHGWLYLPDRNKRDAVGPSLWMLAKFAWVKCPSLPDGIDDPEQLSLDQILALA